MAQKIDILKQNIIIELGLQDLSEERKQELLFRMSDLIQKRVLLRTIKNLSQESRDKFNQLLTEKNDQEAYRLLIHEVPNIEEITDEEVIKFKEEIVEHVKNISF